MDTIILASKSPRRKEILTQLGIPFIQYGIKVNEDLGCTRYIRSAVINISRKKADAADGVFSDGIVLGVDTVVYFNGMVLGKPGTPVEARRFLKMLSGNRHQVLSGITLKNIGSGKHYSGCSVTGVNFCRLNPAEVDMYIESGEWCDKAGGYAVQGKAAFFVSRIEGSYYNVMGLPMEELHRLLSKFSYFKRTGQYQPVWR